MGARGGMGGGGGSAAGTGVVGGSDLASRITVDKVSGKAADAAAMSVFGRKLSDREWASLAGAPDGAHVTIEGRPGSNYVDVRWRTAAGNASRTVGPGGITNHSFYLNEGKTGGGIGVRVFDRQVKTARKLGVKALHTEASRGTGLVGYKVWPKFGYDGKIPAKVRALLPKGLSRATNVSSLMKTRAGRAFWDQHGTSTEMTFDLKAGSRSMRTWEKYRAKKGL